MESPPIPFWLLLYMNQLAHILKDDEGRNIIGSKMPKLRRPSKDSTIGWFKPDGRCKKHPKHRQSPGVCSLCLREKLTQISSTSRKMTTSVASSTSSSVSSLSSCYSTTSASSCASPMHRFRFITEGKSSSSMSIFFPSAKPGLAKSRSLAVLPRRRHDAAAKSNRLVDNNIKSDKKAGFWSKLLHPKGKRKENAKLMHSRSAKERVIVGS
ncbi:hypothetical protein L6164_030619 [Bauhinia variegata]|uniref:Uncharacterized protein n=1 Tax=Bauhinia variegata TaxID=167791 RepID=A0ACB9LCY1_BAUVA|nr:hypothetical protein L6164_030619 [Bauhinia variegata]